jgi:molybdopterin converting factor small subunit
MVRIKFYGVIRSVVGQEEIKIDFKGAMVELLGMLGKLYPSLRDRLGQSVVLLNHKTYDDTDLVGEQDEIIVMPALGGG